jgi:hypothetical protein
MLWVFLTVVVVSSMYFRAQRRAPIGADPALGESLAQLHDEVRALREDLMEVAERVDFTERALADVKRLSPLPEARGN